MVKLTWLTAALAAASTVYAAEDIRITNPQALTAAIGNDGGLEEDPVSVLGLVLS